MVQITGGTTQSRSIDNKLISSWVTEVKNAASSISGGVSEAQNTSAVTEATTTISSLATRLSKAASSISPSTDGLDYKALDAGRCQQRCRVTSCSQLH